MSAILNSLNVHNFLIFQPILTTLVSKFMVYRALSDKTYILLWLRSLKHKVKNLNKHPYMYPGKSGNVCDHPALFLTNNHAILKYLLASYSTVLITCMSQMLKVRNVTLLRLRFYCQIILMK